MAPLSSGQPIGRRRRSAMAASGLALAIASSLLPSAGRGEAAGVDHALAAARAAEPVVLTGAQLAGWASSAAHGSPHPYPSGALDGVRDAHNGTIVVPPDAGTGVPVEEVAAFALVPASGRFREIPVQVDERFPYFLANGRSDFARYSGTDEELTYAWDEEAWKKTYGTCSAEYAPGDGPTPDPVPGLDHDDEVVVMASDLGPRAPLGTPAPGGALPGLRQEITVADPLTGEVRYAYLFRRPGGSGFDERSGYVRYERDADADQFIDAGSFPEGSPEALGTSNTGYGPNLPGTVCDPDGTIRQSKDRFVRDGITVRTASYRYRATGRWMSRGMHVAKPGQEHLRRPGADLSTLQLGPDMIDRWKGRAFQQSPDSQISVVGFEDEQVNWEANSSLLGERVGPIRAIREIWGADSGTNVTKIETFYRDVVQHRYHLRVHPIPPDGLYTSWDYNRGVATRYFTALRPEGVPIDGRNDDLGNVDAVAGFPAFFDAPDPTLDLPTAFGRWEQVSGDGDTGSLVYTFEMLGATSAQNPLVVPYYRDDACLDDGTGDDPVARPWPGEDGRSAKVRDAYTELAGASSYADLTCDQRQGAHGSHGLHFFVTGDTDNAFLVGKPTTEVDGRQWQFAIPTSAPKAIGEPYGQLVRAPLRASATPLP